MFKLTKCLSYNQRAINQALKRVVNLKDYINKGERVLIKPNLLFAANPEKAITTHPNLIKAVVQELNRLGAKPIIADSPGGFYTKNALEKVYTECGINGLKAELNINTSSYEAKNPKGFLKRYKLIHPVREADKIINLPKVKTHMLCTLTCATKNLFGLVPGTEKVSYHARFKIVDDFSKMLVDLAELVRPTLNIIDGVIGMEGQGPSNGTPKRLGILAASDNCFEADYHISNIIGIKPDSIPYLRIAYDKGLYAKEEEDFKEFKVEFKKASSPFMRRLYDKVPVFLKNLISNVWIKKPVVNDKCVGCGDCMRACPAKAISIKNKKSVIDYQKCFRCYCCHELCRYEAIDLKH